MLKIRFKARDVFFVVFFVVVNSTKEVGLKRPYLYEGSEENDPLSIITCIHVKNIEIKTKE